MRVRFWGVRGSLASPQLPSLIKSKISAVVERITPDDLKSPESRERFLAGLPPWLFGTVGGNTPCVSVQLDSDAHSAQAKLPPAAKQPTPPNPLLIFDAGTGIRELAASMMKLKQHPVYHLFLSHFHWDHIVGLPFFNPAYNPSVQLNFYSPFANLEQALHGQMTQPYFPIPMDAMACRKEFKFLSAPIHINGAEISFRKMNHPGGSYSYKVNDGKRVFIYSTDSELSSSDFQKTKENAAYFSGADLLVIDSQYTLGEAIEKYNWGHSAFSMAVDFAANWNIKHVVLFHHDPTYDDQKLLTILQSAKWYIERLNITDLNVSLAMEDVEIVL